MPSLLQIYLWSYITIELVNLPTNYSMKLTNLVVMLLDSSFSFTNNNSAQNILSNHERVDQSQCVILPSCHVQGAFGNFVQI